MKPLIYILISFFLIVYSADAQITYHNKPVKVTDWRNQTWKYVDLELAIKLKPGIQLNQISQALSHHNATVKNYQDMLGWRWIELPEGSDIFSVITDLEQNPLIEYAVPNQIHELQADPNDPYFAGTNPATYSYQWALRNTGQNPPNGTTDADIDVPEAWNISTGNSNVILAILDSGIPIQNGVLSHADLNDSTKIIVGPDFTGEPDNLSKDLLGHGTHVAGIIGAETNNKWGIAGVAWNCKMLIIQVFVENGNGSDQNFLEGVTYAVDYQINNPGKKVVINYSGGSLASSPTLLTAVQYASTYGVTIVASTGNGGYTSDEYPPIEDTNIKYPAHYSETYSNVIAVGATNHNDNRAIYSDYGPQINMVAPGGYGGTTQTTQDTRDIFSAIPNYTTNRFPSLTNYAYLSGTSMAAPHVTGVVGLMLSLNPNLTPLQIRTILQNTTDKVAGMGGQNFTNQYGYGRINAYNALLELAPEITNPVSCGTFYTGNQVSISWKANTSGRTFEIKLSTDNGATFPTVIASSVTSGTTSYSYNWTVTSVNSGNCKFQIKDVSVSGYINKTVVFGINTPNVLATPANFNLTNVGGHPKLTWDQVPDAAGYYLWRASSQYNPPYTWYRFKTMYPFTNGNPTIDYTDFIVTIGASNPHTMKYKMESFNACSTASAQTVEKTIKYEEFMKIAVREENSPDLPVKFALNQNYPNPFNPSTTIEYHVPRTSKVKLEIYDVLGQLAKILVDESKPAGIYRVHFDASAFASGVYFYRLKAGEFTETKKLLFVK